MNGDHSSVENHEAERAERRSAPARRVRTRDDYSLGFGFALRPVLDPFFSESDELARPADPEELPPDEPLAFPEPEESLRPDT